MDYTSSAAPSASSSLLYDLRHFFSFIFYYRYDIWGPPQWVLYNSYRLLHHFCCFLTVFEGTFHHQDVTWSHFVSVNRNRVFDLSYCYSILNTSCTKTSKMLLVEFGPTFHPVCINSRPRSGVQFWIWAHLRIVFFFDFLNVNLAHLFLMQKATFRPLE